MKKLTLNPVMYSISATIFCCISFNSFAQLYIPAGASLNMTGSALLYAGASVINDGTLDVGTGTLVLERDLTDNGTLNAGSGLVKFTGAETQNLTVGSGASLNNVTLDKSSNSVIAQSNMPAVSGTLSLINGTLDLNNFDLTLNGSVSGGSAASYVKTSGTGKLRRNIAAGQTFLFPVGNSSYNSLQIANNNSAADVFAARVTNEVLDGGLAGSNITRGRVKRTWDIQKTNPNAGGGVNLVFGYSASDATGLLSPIMNHFRSGYWMPQYGSYASTPGSSFSYSGYTGSFSPFSIQEYYTSSLDLKAFIQGYYTGSGTMAQALLNSGISGASSSQSDSLTVTLHDAENGNQIGSAVKTILNTNGTAIAQMQGVSGPHYIAARHRNALETWSATPVVFNTDANYDFSTAANKAYGNNQVNVGGGVFAFWSGDVNRDGAIESADYAQLENDIISILFGYQSTDLTGDGAVESADYALIENNLLNVIFVQKPF